MTKIMAKDCRKRAPADMPGIDVEYDPEKIQEFDTRGKCATRWQESWGQKVEVEIGGEHCTLYLEYVSRTVAHTMRYRNILKDC